ncbi:hypothetical protein HOLleu_08879 [Holothuria leucospilota]|uniref:Uncharacterized protein n=1 Tax=Holothuria leucospilota TaxID=206669 RepID=A0A9Q1HI55_HOLLE|nr:hypothetical protein HOLleu_08879 [Holothuria leucospilota]
MLLFLALYKHRIPTTAFRITERHQFAIFSGHKSVVDMDTAVKQAMNGKGVPVLNKTAENNFLWRSS